MNFNFDTGAISDGLQTLDVTTLPPLGGTAGVLTLIGDGALTLLQGGTAARPGTPAGGMFRYNTDTTNLEYYNGTTWTALAVGGGTVTSVDATSNSAALTVTGGPITSSGSFIFDLDADLTAIAALAGIGIAVRTGSGTWAQRTITGTAGNITVTDGNGVAGNPTLDLATLGTPVSASFVKITTDTFGRISATTPVVQSDITTLVDSVYVNVAGDTMTGDLDMGSNSITNLATPVNGGDAVNKDYADALSNGLSWKTSVIAATTGNITLSGAQTIDGVGVVATQRVLVKNQAAPEDNGIYIVSAGAWTRSADMDSTTPVNEINGAAVFVEDGTVNADTAWVQTANVTVLGTDPVIFTQFAGAGSYTAGNGLQLVGNQFSLIAPVSVANGGTGTSTAPSNGQLLIGNGTGYTLSTLTAGTGISVTNGAGSITVANTGVVSIAGTTDQITASASTGAVTLSIPSTFIAPGSIRATTTLTVDTLTANGALYATTGGEIVSTAALTDGQILIGDTGSTPVATTITAGAGVTVTNGAGSITIAADTSTLVTTFSAGTTGFTPGSPTSGAITLAGTLNTTNGGTGLSTIGTANQFLAVNTGATALEYKTVSAGTGISVTPGAGVLTIANTGVTSVALALPVSVFTVTGSPVTTTGTLTGSFATQTANTLFAGPTTGGAATPTFRALVFDDLAGAIQLYRENPSTPTTPLVAGTNAVAIGSDSSAPGTGTFAVGSGTSASIFGSKAFANGSFATAGDAQSGMYVLRNITTNNTATALFLDGTGASQRLVVGNNSVWTFDILVTARRTDATGGGAGYRFVGVIRKDATAGSTTFVGTPSKTVIGETDAAWDASVTANTTNGDLRVTVTGQNAKTIRWVAVVQTAEVTN
jgi:hypothetical protein